MIEMPLVDKEDKDPKKASPMQRIPSGSKASKTSPNGSKIIMKTPLWVKIINQILSKIQ